MAPARVKLSGGGLEICDRDPIAANSVRLRGSFVHRRSHAASPGWRAGYSVGNQSIAQHRTSADGVGRGCRAVSVLGTVRLSKNFRAVNCSIGFQSVSCIDWATVLSRSHIVADFAGPCAVIFRYRLEAYATLLYFTPKTPIVVRKSIARWRITSFGVCGLALPLICSVSYASRSGFLPATSAASLVCSRSSSKM